MGISLFVCLNGSPVASGKQFSRTRRGAVAVALAVPAAHHERDAPGMGWQGFSAPSPWRRIARLVLFRVICSGSVMTASKWLFELK